MTALLTLPTASEQKSAPRPDIYQILAFALPHTTARKSDPSTVDDTSVPRVPRGVQNLKTVTNLPGCKSRGSFSSQCCFSHNFFLSFTKSIDSMIHSLLSQSSWAPPFMYQGVLIRLGPRLCARPGLCIHSLVVAHNLTKLLLFALHLSPHLSTYQYSLVRFIVSYD